LESAAGGLQDVGPADRALARKAVCCDSQFMRSHDAGECWERNADGWTRLARAGYDVYRDAFNTPAFLESLPDVKGLHGLDIGCGEGHNTRLVAERGARMSAVDIAPTFIRHAQAFEAYSPLGITYLVADACSLPFNAESFDFAVAFMSLMDIPTPDRALGEALRVLRPGGFLQFSITHPCFDTPHRRNVRDEDGRTVAIEVGDYFDQEPGRLTRWLFSSAPAEARRGIPDFEVPQFHRPLSCWVNDLCETGFTIERINEPSPSDPVVAAWPAVQDAQVVAYFLHVRARKARAA